jgi:hypothetical protein
VKCESDTDGRFTSSVFFCSVCLYESRVSFFLVLRKPAETTETAGGEAATASVGAEAAAGAIEDDVEVRADASIKKEAVGA